MHAHAGMLKYVEGEAGVCCVQEVALLVMTWMF